MINRKVLKNVSKKTYIIIGIGFVVLAIIVSLIIFKHKKTEEKRPSNYIGCNQIENASAPISPSKTLNDKNDIHLLHAQTNGLKEPFESNETFFESIDEFVSKSILVEVTNNSYYQLKKLTHSHPYLIPEAVDMLNDIGYRFHKRLEEKKYPNYQFRVTSLLRTEETQNKLSKRNMNATGHSAHIYGTTIDISYKDFYNVKKDTIESNYLPVQALTDVLIEMRKECKFLVVRERKQSCFHITVVMCKPKQTD